MKNYSKSLLKSAVQKAVRRIEPEKAVACAKAWMEMEPNDFLRRLPIIIIEDAILHPKMDEVLRLLEKGPKHVLTDEDKQFLIQIVYDIAAIKVRDDWVDEDAGVWENPEEVEANKFKGEVPADTKEFELVRSILKRSFMGGMGGDIVMLKNSYNLWVSRFAKKEWTVARLEKLYEGIPKIKYEEVPNVKRDDIIIASVDMHCSPLLNILMRKAGMVEMLNSYFPEEPDAKIKLNDLLWRQLSSPNYKLEVGSGKTRDWYAKGRGLTVSKEKETAFYDKIKKEIENIQKWFLAKQ